MTHVTGIKGTITTSDGVTREFSISDVAGQVAFIQWGDGLSDTVEMLEAISEAAAEHFVPKCTRCGDPAEAGKTLCDYCEEDSCTHCGESLEGGEGFDGYCGDCADVLESHKYWDGGDQAAALAALAAEVDAKGDK